MALNINTLPVTTVKPNTSFFSFNFMGNILEEECEDIKRKFYSNLRDTG